MCSYSATWRCNRTSGACDASIFMSLSYTNRHIDRCTCHRKRDLFALAVLVQEIMSTRRSVWNDCLFDARCALFASPFNDFPIQFLFCLLSMLRRESRDGFAAIVRAHLSVTVYCSFVSLTSQSCRFFTGRVTPHLPTITTMNFFKKVDPKEAARQAKRDTRKEVRVRALRGCFFTNWCPDERSKALTISDPRFVRSRTSAIWTARSGSWTGQRSR
jgi:hypothetical protein